MTLLIGRVSWTAVVGVLALGTTAIDAVGQVTATIEVTVRGASPGGRGAQPLEGATVAISASGATASTDSEGRAVLRGLTPGHHAVLVSALGFEETEAAVEVANGRSTRLTLTLLPAPLQVAGLEVTLEGASLPPGGVAIQTSALDAAVVDLASAIDRVPGATVVRQGGPGAPAAVQLRGSGAAQVLVLLDGVAINSPVTGIADLSTVDLERLGRIVVLPGTQSARYGPRALGGVVLLESRVTSGRALTASVGLGSWSSKDLAATASVRPADSWDVVGSTRWIRSDGDFTYEIPDFRGGGETARLNADHEQFGGDVRVAREGRVTMGLRGHGSLLERGSPGTVAQPSLTGEQRHLRYGVSFDTRVGAETGGASAVVAVQWQHAEYADTAPPFGQTYEARTDVRQSRIAFDAWRRLPFLTVRGGADMTRLDVASTTLADSDLAVDEIGAWVRAENTTELGSGVTLSVSGGARLDRHDLVDGATPSPSANLSVDRGGTTLGLGWGFGFSPPGLGDLFFQEGVLVEPNPDLRPERVRNEITVSLGQRWSGASGAFEFRATAYDADVDDMILWFPDFRFIWSPVNIDVARRGLEVAATAEYALFGERQSFSANIARSKVEYREPSLSGQVAYRPDLTAEASLTLSLGAAAVTPAWRYVGERRSAAGSDLNPLDAYDLLDVGVSLPFALGGRNARLDITLSNVFDERAALLVDYPLPGRGWFTRLRLLSTR